MRFLVHNRFQDLGNNAQQRNRAIFGSQTRVALLVDGNDLVNLPSVRNRTRTQTGKKNFGK